MLRFLHWYINVLCIIYLIYYLIVYFIIIQFKIHYMIHYIYKKKLNLLLFICARTVTLHYKFYLYPRCFIFLQHCLLRSPLIIHFDSPRWFLIIVNLWDIYSILKNKSHCTEDMLGPAEETTTRCEWLSRETRVIQAIGWHSLYLVLWEKGVSEA